jgi:hypothetical protein
MIPEYVVVAHTQRIPVQYHSEGTLLLIIANSIDKQWAYVVPEGV